MHAQPIVSAARQAVQDVHKPQQTNLQQTELNLQFDYQSPEQDDFERVNGILAQVLPQALTFLAVDCIGEAAQDTGKIGQLLAIWDVGVARDAAWDFADHLRSLPEVAKPVALAAQDRLTGVIGRSLLLPLAGPTT